MIRRVFLCLSLIAFCVAALPFDATAASKSKIDRRVTEAISEFHEIVSGSEELLARAKGVLIFPKVTKGGIGIGYEGGSGALQIGGQTVQYYRMDSPSVGFQLGVQQRRQIFLFLEDRALNKFRNSSNWEIGVDGSVALVTLDAGGEVNTETFEAPTVAFVYGSKGLMYNLSLEGTKISKIDPN